MFGQIEGKKNKKNPTILACRHYHPSRKKSQSEGYTMKNLSYHQPDTFTIKRLFKVRQKKKESFVKITSRRGKKKKGKILAPVSFFFFFFFSSPVAVAGGFRMQRGVRAPAEEGWVSAPSPWPQRRRREAGGSSTVGREAALTARPSPGTPRLGRGRKGAKPSSGERKTGPDGLIPPVPYVLKNKSSGARKVGSRSMTGVGRGVCFSERRGTGGSFGTRGAWDDEHHLPPRCRTAPRQGFGGEGAQADVSGQIQEISRFIFFIGIHFFTLPQEEGCTEIQRRLSLQSS